MVRTLLKVLCERVRGIDILAAEEKLEQESSYERSLACQRLLVRFAANGS